MTDELATPDDIAGFQSLDKDTSKEFTQNVFIPGLTFVTGTSDVATSNPPQAQQGQYFGHNQALTDPVIIISDVRWHAIFFKNKEKIAESFNPQSPVYQDIKKDVPNYNYKKGYCPRECLSFLIYIPELGEFCVLYPASRTQRSMAGDISKYITPIDKRDSEASKALGIKHIFRLGFITLNNSFKTKIPTAKPLDELPEEYADPGKEALARAIKIFRRPIIQELENPVEESTEEDSDR